MEKVNVLITGAAGFIGYHLVKELITIENISVVGIDNMNNYYDVELKQRRLIELGIHAEYLCMNEPIQSTRYSNFTFCKLDICDREALGNFVKSRNINVLVNLAAQPGVRYSIDNPYAYVDSNLIGFVNILELCRNNKIAKLIFASSSSVYGSNIKQPFSTFDNTDFPVSLYAATKKCNEVLAHSYSHLFGIKCIGLRFFTVYGPFGRPDMAYFDFTKKIFNGEEISLFNHGNMERDFTYIDDIVMAIRGLVYHNVTRKRGTLTNGSSDFKIYNIGNNKPVSLKYFIEVLEENCGRRANLIYKEMQPGDVRSTFADIDDLVEDINFKPSISIEEGLERFVSWYKEYYG